MRLAHECASDRVGTVPWAFVPTPGVAAAASAADAAAPPSGVPKLATSQASLRTPRGSSSPPRATPPRTSPPRLRPTTRIAVSGSSALSELFVLEPAPAPVRPAPAAVAGANGHARLAGGEANGDPTTSGSPNGYGGGAAGGGGGGTRYADDPPSMKRLGRLSLFAVTPDERVSAPIVTAIAAAAADSPSALVGLASGAVAHMEVQRPHLGSMVFLQRPSREQARQLSAAALLGLYGVPPQGVADTTATTPAGAAAAIPVGNRAGDGGSVPSAPGTLNGGGQGDAVTALVGLGGNAFASGHRSGGVRLWSSAYVASPPVEAGGVWHRVHPAVTTDGVARRVYRSSPVRTLAALSSAVTCLTAVAWPMGAGATATLLAAGTEDGVLVVLHPKRPDVSPLLLHGSDCGSVSAVVFCSDAAGVPTEDVTLASGGEDDMVHVHIVPAARLLPPPLVAAAAMPPPPSGRRRQPRRLSLAGHTGFVTGLAWFPPASTLLSTGLDGALLAWHRSPAGGGASAEWVPSPTVLPLPALGPLLSVAVVPRAEEHIGSATVPAATAARPRAAAPPALAASSLPSLPPPVSPAELYVGALFDNEGRVKLHRFAVDVALPPPQLPGPTEDVLMEPEGEALPPD
ncbi:hypothetical protein MMPV_005526 [Pyropia vietnamensis]